MKVCYISNIFDNFNPYFISPKFYGSFKLKKKPPIKYNFK